MGIIRWKPFHDLEQFFDDFHAPFRKNGWDLAVDVIDNEDSLTIEMHVPGIDPDKVDISVKDNHLYISGSREKKEEVKDQDYYHKEIRRGHFERVIALPAAVLSSEARAEFKDGVLRIWLPKDKNKESRKIKVEKR